MPKGSRTQLFVKIIAWAALIGGSLTAVFGLFGGLAFLFTPLSHTYQDMPHADPAWAAAMDHFVRTQSIIGLFKIPFYIAVAVSGGAVLKGREWGRKILESLTWFFIAVNIAMAIYTATSVDMGGMFKTLPNSKLNSAQFAAGAGIAMKVMTGVATLFWCALLAVSGWFLRRRETRALFEAE